LRGYNRSIMRYHLAGTRITVFLFLLAAGGAAGGPRGAEEVQPVRVFSAVGASEALERIGTAFTRKTGTPVKIVTGGSVALSKEILHGAPADIFVPEGAGVLLPLLNVALVDEGSTLLLATNSLVVAAPADRARPLSSPEELAGEGFRVLVRSDPDLSPTGILAKRSLMALGLWDKLKGRVRAFRKVDAAVDFLESGQADLGIFYLTDVRERPRLKTVLALPPASYDAIRYSASLVARPGAPVAARAFLTFLRGPDAREAILASGLTPQ
jgi:molybdate transport system substrate-binding protein